MEKGIIGRKVGMTQIFDEDGKVVPVTIIEAGPCVVTQKKTEEKDGYKAIQLGFSDTVEKLSLIHIFFARADAVRRREKGEFVEVRALLEFSNHCRRLCRYCGLNAENRKLPRFRLAPSEIVSLSQEAARAGYRTVVLQSGEDLSLIHI